MNVIRHLSVAARTLSKTPGLAVTVVLLLGFGVGANTALFSVVRAVLLQPIPGVERSGDLVRVRRSFNGTVQSNQSYPDYVDYRDYSQTLDGLSAERLGAMRLSGAPAQVVRAAIVTGNYFHVLGVRAAAGRLFTPDDDRTPGGHPVAVLSESFWRSEFAADPGVIGRTLVLNGHPFTVAGVAAAPFQGIEFGERTAVWIPLMMVRAFMTRSPDFAWFESRRAGWLTFYGRLKPGVSMATAHAELNTIARRLAERYPESNSGRGIEISRHPGMTPEQRAALRNLLGLLLASVCLVLLIACGNVATLLLARAAARSREMAIRLALGASRRCVLLQVLSESVLLAAAGATLGLLLAPWMRTLLLGLWGGPQLTASETALDLRLLGFTIGISLACVLLFGLAPAWAAARTDPGNALKSAGARATGSGRLQRVCVIAQVSLSVALVAGSSLVLRSMQRILAIDPGYRPERVVMATIDLSILGYTPERGAQFFNELLAHAQSIPGVLSATLAKSTPAQDWSDRVTVGPSEVDRNTIGPGYFRTLGISLIAGRDFTAADRRGSAPVAILSRALADRLWPGENAIGKRILAPAAMEVIGVAADSRYRSILQDPPLLLYVPLFQNYDSISRLMVSVDGSPALFRRALVSAIHQGNPDLPLRTPATMTEQIEQSVWRQRAAASLLGFFGVLALALACAGIHGVIAYSTANRTREIGIRMALGADRIRVLGEVMGQGLRIAIVGIVLGLPIAVWAKAALQAFLYQSPALEPIAVAGVPLLFVLVAAAASFLPARRASAIDPAVTLRHE